MPPIQYSPYLAGTKGTAMGVPGSAWQRVLAMLLSGAIRAALGRQPAENWWLTVRGAIVDRLRWGP